MQLPLTWIVASLCVAVLTGFAGAWLARSRKKAPQALPREWALTARPVFNAHERRAYRLLRDTFPQLMVLSKLPLVRFCQPVDPNTVRYWFDLLGATHVSFAICSANGRVLAAIDLEGERGMAQRAVQIKRAVLSACQVRYWRCAADELPTVSELQRLVPTAAELTPTAHANVIQTRNRLASTVASRRLERVSMWHESEMALDSTYAGGPLSRQATGDVNSLLPDPGASTVRH